MMEKPSSTTSSSSSRDINAAAIKRYAHPNQRNNRYLGRRKSGGKAKLDHASSYANEGEKNQVAASKNFSCNDAGSGILVNENANSRLISLCACCSSEAFQLLNDRWAAAMDAYSNPSINLSERPLMYSGNGASAWGNFRLPHQMDFLSELKLAMQNANPNIKF